MREAHRIIAAWKNDEPDKRYLLVACDHHQRLRLAGSAATIIEGLKPWLHGPHVAPAAKLPKSVSGVCGQLGADVPLIHAKWAEGHSDDKRVLGSVWIQCRGTRRTRVGIEQHQRLPSGQSLVLHGFAFSQRPRRPATGPVTSSRRRFVGAFRGEETLFDYEQLAAFTYHPMQGDGSAGIIDKYIKGQEFSVVVVEGLPRAAFGEPASNPGAIPSEDEMQMWQARRELFLCASRANVFLFFVLRDGAPGEAENERLLAELRKPHDAQRRVWQFDASARAQLGRRPRPGARRGESRRSRRYSDGFNRARGLFCRLAPLAQSRPCQIGLVSVLSSLSSPPGGAPRRRGARPWSRALGRAARRPRRW